MPAAHPLTDQPAPLRAGGGELAGPWLQAFWFYEPGQVRSKANHRRGDRRSGASAWSQEASYQLALTAAAKKFRPDGWVKGVAADSVEARPKFVVFCYARSLLDVGNLDKSVLDALQGPVMVNDTQVVWSSSAGTRTSADPGGLVADPGLLVAIARLSPSPTLAECAAAAAALAQHAVTVLAVDA